MKAICKNLKCPKTHEIFEVREKCPICNVSWGTLGCKHTPWSKQVKGMIYCPFCGSDDITDPQVLQFLRVGKIKEFGKQIVDREKFTRAMVEYEPRAET